MSRKELAEAMIKSKIEEIKSLLNKCSEIAEAEQVKVWFMLPNARFSLTYRLKEAETYGADTYHRYGDWAPLDEDGWISSSYDC